MTFKLLIFVILLQVFSGECSQLRQLPIPILNETLRSTLNKTVALSKKALSLVNETSLANFTFTVPIKNQSSTELYQVDCLGLGKTVAKTLEWFFQSQPNGSNALDVQFFMSSRRQPQRVRVVLDEQFGLEWTDFKAERRTVIIVHGFLSHGQETWIRNMEQAFLEWGDVNVMVVDWSAGGNTWNYYKAALNTRVVGYQIAKLIEHITNATIGNESDTINRGPLHLIGHSLGAHICGFAAKELKKRKNSWTVHRITGLDPAQPCFRNSDQSVHLNKNDAPFVDVIHTNGKLLMQLGLGLPYALGHVDFYPNGGKVQPGCVDTDSFFNYLPIPPTIIKEAICSHGRSYLYFTESLITDVANNCSFSAHPTNVSYEDFLRAITEPCDGHVCSEMGIKAERFKNRGSFFVVTSSSAPFCAYNASVVEEVKEQLEVDYREHGKNQSFINI